VTLTRAFSSKKNFFYSIEGSISSGAEIAVTMIVGSLPPLRKPFDRFLKLILPENLMESKFSTPSFIIPVFSTKGSQATSGNIAEDDSAIFHRDHDQDEENTDGTVRTPQAMVEDREPCSGCVV
jgi:hypothetical protein